MRAGCNFWHDAAIGFVFLHLAEERIAQNFATPISMAADDRGGRFIAGGFEAQYGGKCRHYTSHIFLFYFIEARCSTHQHDEANQADMKKLRIGTRGSPLALAQAHETRERLMAAHGFASEQIEIVVITTTGDRVRDRPLAEIGGKGLFTKEIEEALFAREIDLAVHSMKDMPALVPQGLAFAAVLPREDARDAFLSFAADTLQDLPQGAKLGSSSVRRTAQALRLRADLVSVQFRGNVDTRLRKLKEGVAAATFLAVAGLNRLKLTQHITRIMPMDEMLPAVAQGAIGIEIRDDDHVTRGLVEAINHRESFVSVSSERAFLATLEGSCQTPLAAYAVLNGGGLHLRAEALTLDGRNVFQHEIGGSVEDAVAMGREAGERIKSLGGAKLLIA
jgi:hydroxymethylbilane synthase